MRPELPHNSGSSAPQPGPIEQASAAAASLAANPEDSWVTLERRQRLAAIDPRLDLLRPAKIARLPAHVLLEDRQRDVDHRASMMALVEYRRAADLAKAADLECVRVAIAPQRVLPLDQAQALAPDAGISGVTGAMGLARGWRGIVPGPEGGDPDGED